MTPLSTFWHARYRPGFSSRAEIASHHARQWDWLRRFVLPQSPFYADFAAKSPEDWPIMDKASLMAQFTEINTRNLPRDKALALLAQSQTCAAPLPRLGEVTLSLSAGTSGGPNLFLTDRREQALRSNAILGRFLPGPLLGYSHVALFQRPDHHPWAQMAHPLARFHHYNLNEALSRHLPQLQAQQPGLLIAPAQMLSQLAQAQLSGALKIAPRRIVSRAEVLSAQDQAQIHEAFGIWPDQIYDSQEALIAQSCAHGSLHLNERQCHIEHEVIDAETGAFRPIVTSFTQQTLPILRYRLDDILIPDPTPCPCGCASQRLLRIEGRAEDMIYWRRLNGGQRLVSAQLLSQAIGDITVPVQDVPVQDYRLIQAGPDQLELALDSPAFTRAAQQVQRNLEALAQTLDCALPKIRFRERIVQTPDVPRRRIRNLPPLDLVTHDLDGQDLGGQAFHDQDLAAQDLAPHDLIPPRTRHPYAA